MCAKSLIMFFIFKMLLIILIVIKKYKELDNPSHTAFIRLLCLMHIYILCTCICYIFRLGLIFIGLLKILYVFCDWKTNQFPTEVARTQNSGYQSCVSDRERFEIFRWFEFLFNEIPLCGSYPITLEFSYRVEKKRNLVSEWFNYRESEW